MKPGEFDVIFAAVPCTEYSMALTTRPRDLPLADAVVRRTLEVISFLQSPIVVYGESKNWIVVPKPVGLRIPAGGCGLLSIF